MTPPTSFFLPSHIPVSSGLSSCVHPILVVSETRVELVTFAITFARFSATGRSVLITTIDNSSFVSDLKSSVSKFPSSSLNSTSLILASDAITVYHVDSLPQLRALLSTLQHSNIRLLAIDGFISLHEPESEMSAQGISRTLAAMVNITSSSNGVLILREPQSFTDISIPVLNSGVGGGLSQTTVPMNRVVGRWVRGFWIQGADKDGDCSADWISRGQKWHVRWTLRDGEIDDVQVSLR